jgi:hypothetical protein
LKVGLCREVAAFLPEMEFGPGVEAVTLQHLLTTAHEETRDHRLAELAYEALSA